MDDFLTASTSSMLKPDSDRRESKLALVSRSGGVGENYDLDSEAVSKREER